MSAHMPNGEATAIDLRSSLLRLVPAPKEARHEPIESVSPTTLSPPLRTMSEADQWWIDALCRGDSDALTRLYREHHEPVRALVRRLLSLSSDVEDIVHEVFVAAPAAFRNYRGEGTVRSFLFTMSVHYVRRHVRGSTRRRGWLERLHLVPTREPPTQPDVHSERRQLAERIRAALDTLSFDHRAAVVLCEVEELSSVEAASVLGVPESTVRTRLHYAKKKLRACLEGEAS